MSQVCDNFFLPILESHAIGVINFIATFGITYTINISITCKNDFYLANFGISCNWCHNFFCHFWNHMHY